MEARTLRGIELHETEPATEWLLEEPVQKASPKRTHGLVQFAVARALYAWAQGRGEVVTEWRFRITPLGGYARPFVPDVAYVAKERLAGLTGDDLEQPLIAPDIVVEVLSSDDRADRVEHKRTTYLAAGTKLVLIFDPAKRTLDATDAGGRRYLKEPDVFTTPVFADLTLPLAEVFADISL